MSGFSIYRDQAYLQNLHSVLHAKDNSNKLWLNSFKNIKISRNTDFDTTEKLGNHFGYKDLEGCRDKVVPLNWENLKIHKELSRLYCPGY